MAKSVGKQRDAGMAPPCDNDQQGADQGRDARVKSLLPRGILVAGWIGMFVFTFHACTRMVAAGDTWVAMACGRHFINHGVDTVEPFSANSHKAGPSEEEIQAWPRWAQSIANTVGMDAVRYWHPTGWVNQNWLTHVIFYWLTTSLGSEEEPFFDALVYWKFGLYFLTVICLYVIARELDVHPALAAASACFAMFVGRSFLDVRPAGFSNLLVPVYILLLVLTTRRNVLFIWLIVPLSVFWANVHGGYLYVFIMLVPFYLLNLLALPFRNHCVSIGMRGLNHTMAAGIAAFVAMVVFNPFHLTNLTHTFEISMSEHAERWRQVHEWHPAFDWSNPVGTAKPFLVMYILAWLALVVWLVFRKVTSSSVFAKAPKLRNKRSDGRYEWPKFDLALLVVAALTIYMAIRSRRFIPIAAFAACPILAMLFDQTVKSVAACTHFHKQGRLVVPAMPSYAQGAILALFVAVVAVFGTWVGLRYKKVYLDAWPPDPHYSSVFMRMTASFYKPFNACKFIRQNKLSGNMMNYWTEGGFIGWGQVADPNTGKTPLQLFMDGRAQAAYDRKAFDQWHQIWGGGRVAARLQVKKQRAKREDYIEMGEWISQALRNRDVWVALVPQGQFGRPFCRALEYNNEWPIVFINNKQKLFVDATTEKGKALFAGIGTGQTVYPDEFTRALNLGRYHLMYDRSEGAKKKGLDFLIKAYELNPTPAPVIEVLSLAVRFTPLHTEVTTFCQQIADDFDEQADVFIKQDGYRGRLEAARMSCGFLARLAQQRKRPAEEARYTQRAKEISAERDWQGAETRW